MFNRCICLRYFSWAPALLSLSFFPKLKGGGEFIFIKTSPPSPFNFCPPSRAFGRAKAVELERHEKYLYKKIFNS
jgi:hypothetical protein